MLFKTDKSSIYQQLNALDPVAYGATRNFVDGKVSRLSPYISRGVLSTKQVFESLIARGYTIANCMTLLKELAWREYFQVVAKHLKDGINKDIKPRLEGNINMQMPESIAGAQCGIDVVDNGIVAMLENGYMHNHMRMYVASICCNIAKCHWSNPAKWMFYHLLDADWASNSLSWQWVGGSFSSKKYFANQQNINHFTKSEQVSSFLDLPYESLQEMPVPETLKNQFYFNEACQLPNQHTVQLNEQWPTCVYNFYNLDFDWLIDQQMNRVLLLEPSLFDRYPVSPKVIDFVLDLAKNIPDIQLFVGSFEALYDKLPNQELHFKEHPLNNHYKGTQHKREFIFEEVDAFYPSFSAYWKQCQKYIITL